MEQPGWASKKLSDSWKEVILGGKSKRHSSMSGSIPESAETCLGGGLGVFRAEVGGVGARDRGVGTAEGTVNRVTAVLGLR